MALIADILLIAGALGAAFYCLVLSRRLTEFSRLEDGMGGAIAQLSSQVAEMNAALNRANAAAAIQVEEVQESTKRAEAAARNLELLMASMHDLPSAPPPASPVDASDPEISPETEVKPSGPTFRRRLGPAAGKQAAE